MHWWDRPSLTLKKVPSCHLSRIREETFINSGMGQEYSLSSLVISSEEWGEWDRSGETYTLSIRFHFIGERDKKNTEANLKKINVPSFRGEHVMDICCIILCTFIYLNFFPNKKRRHFQMMTTKTNCLVQSQFSYCNRYHPKPCFSFICLFVFHFLGERPRTQDVL